MAAVESLDIIYNNPNNNPNNQILRLKLLKFDTISYRIRGMVTSYLERFGLAYVGLYRFTDTAKTPDWTNYLTVLNITLNREGLRPAHLWIRNGDDCLLLLCISGYFRAGMDDVTDALARLWRRRAPCGSPPALIQAWRAEAASTGNVITGIFQTLGQIAFDPRRQYRQRGFGSSMI